ncbi:MAG: phosphate signaling complex protein PhoU [Anaerolineae bacterium]|nr:phosphate signaling complex protein PhoU [Anaerolineae bacterium]
MLREAYQKELQRLQDETLELGSRVESALIKSVELLKRRDLEGARQLVLADREINATRFAIEEKALVLIATQQPIATDLRILAAILEIITELERIGDYAKGIGRINLMMGNEPFIKPLIDIPLMAEKARDMLERALTAFIEMDVELARTIPPEDDEVDNLYNQVYRELLTYIIADPTTIEQANYLLWAAHNLERAADRVINICERVVFTATGKMTEMDVSDDEMEDYLN